MSRSLGSLLTTRQESQGRPATASPAFKDPASPTLDEVLRRYKRAPCSGKQCPHPANVWFISVPRRPSAQSQRGGGQLISSNNKSNTRVLAELLTGLTPDTAEGRRILREYMYRSNDDAELLRLESEASLFPQFRRLPAELQERVWKAAAVPRRRWAAWTCTYPNVRSARNIPPPVPQVASACCAARHVVLRQGRRVALRRGADETEWSHREEPGPLSTRHEREPQDFPVGFLMKGDVLFFDRDPTLGFSMGSDRQPMQMKGDDAAEIWTATKALDIIRDSRALGVRWQDPCSHLRGPNHPDDRYGQQQIASWSFLKACAALETLFVDFRSLPVTLQLPVRRADITTPAQDRRPWCVVEFAQLYDDERLAQLTRLETNPQRSAVPRYRCDAGRVRRDGGLHARHAHPGRCLNCERVQWECYHKHVVERFWLQLWADELCEADRAAVFPSPTTYDVGHPWVKEKMRLAPDFTPVVMFRFELQLDPEPTA
ncbi:hypothetical protein O9K51_10007 [Purpureocillium lavendulum]|uniref:2EXR domain-containing protein n=1 Tax=Purpureocillium lavendulum TaxID=1247861 RepID=A0AB34FEZ4_9HYPO|nr:hypothetical protein O9K51_10007 [Purpureocillium lavendulum]